MFYNGIFFTILATKVVIFYTITFLFRIFIINYLQT